MQEAGRKLRRIRERLRLKYRDVQEATQRIAAKRQNPEFSIGLSRLADIENRRTVPSVYRLYSLSAIYGLDFNTVLSWYGVDLQNLPADAASPTMTQTRPFSAQVSDHTLIQLPSELETMLDLTQTSYLSRHLQPWGKLPLALLNSLEVRKQYYAFIGTEDWSMDPLIPPGSFIQIDESKRRITNDGWSDEHDRPIYFLEDRAGYRCRWCTEQSGLLILQPHSRSHIAPEVLRCPGDVEVLGQVVGVAMRLDLGKRRRTRS
ncbi:MAG: hypothetical protein JO033_24100 [Acidobacteriaceae bacterium]|nr:hypothetical protein [Acidobacteriaceae bacterium]MBV9497954.1 hypothetical protein [Acidobacteriaceae bacterium]